MSKWTEEDLHRVSRQADQVRNVSVIAHVDHGKSTLSDSLLATAGLMNAKKAGSERITDTDKTEQERGITIYSTGVSMLFSLPEATRAAADAVGAQGHVETDVDADSSATTADSGNNSSSTPATGGSQKTGKELVMNLIDSPGHVDFSSEVTAALRVTDGAFVVVDAVEGVAVQTETVLRQALSERVRPVLVINKVDRLLGELQLSEEEIYERLRKVIESVNALIATYSSEVMGDLSVDPAKGTVVFASGLMGWAFSLRDFARMYTAKFGLSRPDGLMRRMWGDSWYNHETKKWERSAGDKTKRGFCEFVLEPLYRVWRGVSSQDVEGTKKLLRALKVNLKDSEVDSALKGDKKTAMRTVLGGWLPCGAALVELAAVHLPSPVEAQKYRMEILYTGDLDDEAARSIAACDASGPLVMYISKMVPGAEKGRFTAFGRVFSGTLRSGVSMRILGPNYVAGNKKDLAIGKATRVVTVMGAVFKGAESVTAGNTAGVVGVDGALVKSGTLTANVSGLEIAPIRTMKFSVSAVVRRSVAPKKASDLPALVDGLKMLRRSDPMVQARREDTGEFVVAGAGELHLDVALRALEERFARVELTTGQPIVSFRETVGAVGNEPVLKKSTNKLNRLWATAEPLSESLVTALDDGQFSLADKRDGKTKTRSLVAEYGWDDGDAKKLWAWGPEGAADGAATNALVDRTKAVSYLNESRDLIVAGWQGAISEGVLAREEMRGVQYNLSDAQLHSDGSHRGQQQLLPAARSVMHGAQLSADPRLLEPVYSVDISVHESALGGVYSTLSSRRGVVEMEEPQEGTPMYRVTASLPVLESFGFTSALQAATAGKAFPQMAFSHWQMISGSPLEDGSTAHGVMMSIRKRKGLSATIPALGDYTDRM